MPTALLKLGVIQLPNTAGVLTAYNLNPFPVTYQGTTYQPATCGGQICDPRGLGINPLVQQVWNQMPLPNDPQFSNTGNGIDGINAQGYLGALALPQSSNFFVARIDHDFGDKWKFMSSYRYYSYLPADQQPDDSERHRANTRRRRRGRKSRISSSPDLPDSSPLTSPTIFASAICAISGSGRISAACPSFAGLGGALEMGGESAATNALIPTNVNSQNTRQRFWDGHDQFYSDNLSWLHGNHLFQFGGSYMRNFDFHSRNDNGVGIDTSTTYQITNGSGIPPPLTRLPAGFASSQATNFASVLLRSSRNRRPVPGDVYSRGHEPDAAAARRVRLRPEHHSHLRSYSSATRGT